MAQRLLLIDENRQLLALVGDYLSNLGYEVHRAGESDEAMALLRNYQYSTVITGTEWENFDGPGHNLTQCIENLAQKPRIIRLEENHADFTSTLDGRATQVIEKPTSLLRLGNLLEIITSS
jgi:DNA-binding NtrC family response regulator